MTDINFRTHDKEFMTLVRKAVVEGSPDPNAWKLVLNQLYMDDMMEYLRSLWDTPVISGTGNLVPNVVFIAPSAFDNSIADIKTTLRQLGIHVESVWVTPVIKSLSIPEPILIKYLLMEIKQLAPQFVVVISELMSNDLIQVSSTIKNGSNVKLVEVAQANIKEALEEAISCCKMI